MTSTARRRRDLSGPVPILVPPIRRRRRRLEWQILRWQARLDTSWADRVVPAVAAGVLFAVWTAMAFTRVDRIEAGNTLARYVQAVWHLSANHAPDTTVGAAGDVFADRFPVLLAPVGLLARVLPVTPLLLTIQSASLALGAFPLWRLARRVANLGVGSACALLLVYAVHPALADLDLADFNPATMALTPLLMAVYLAERRRWWWFAVAASYAVLWSSELALVVAALGVALMLEGKARPGRRILLAGLAWTAVALLFVQSPLGSTGLVGPGAFRAYGSNGLDVVIEMIRNPFRPLGDVLAEENLGLVVWVLAPLLFLPVLGLRKLAPVLPLQALYFVADVPVTGASGGGRMVPLVVFSFSAATFALARLGRPRLDRMLVDRRLLGLLVVGAMAAAAMTSPLSPYRRPWLTDGVGEADARVALAHLPLHVPIRVPESLAPRVAERDELYVLEDDFPTPAAGAPSFPAPAELIRGVDALVIDVATLGLDEDGAERLRLALRILGFLQVRSSGDLRIYLPYTPATPVVPALDDADPDEPVVVPQLGG